MTTESRTSGERGHVMVDKERDKRREQWALFFWLGASGCWSNVFILMLPTHTHTRLHDHTYIHKTWQAAIPLYDGKNYKTNGWGTNRQTKRRRDKKMWKFDVLLCRFYLLLFFAFFVWLLDWLIDWSKCMAFYPSLFLSLSLSPKSPATTLCMHLCIPTTLFPLSSHACFSVHNLAQPILSGLLSTCIALFRRRRLPPHRHLRVCVCLCLCPFLLDLIQ